MNSSKYFKHETKNVRYHPIDLEYINDRINMLNYELDYYDFP